MAGIVAVEIFAQDFIGALADASDATRRQH
jgi:hypothetical protein